MKIFLRHKSQLLFLLAMSFVLFACEKEYFPEPPKTAPAPVPIETTVLEAAYLTKAPITIADSYWKGANYLKVPLTALNTNSLYSNGNLNMTGTYNGLSSFNSGNDAKVVMKAAYDNSKVYVYVEWVDDDINPAFASSLVKGPIDPLKADTTGGWTSQGNSDKVALAFNIANATSSAGTFIDKGCAASCHNNKMQPQSGSVDIWKWDVASSDALGYATDLYCDGGNELMSDNGTGISVRNKKDAANTRSEPAYEWNGVEQSYIRPDGKSVTLDPGYFLLDQNKVAYTGNQAKGEKVFHNSVYGCNHCHGDNGNGVGTTGEATAFASVGFARKYSRTTLKSTAASDDHQGKVYYDQVPASDVDDLIAFIKGLGSVPGNYLNTPTGSSADIWTVSNMSRTKIDVSKAHTVYQVIFVRNLSTGNADDVQFTSPEGTSIPFGIALMDGDGKNHVGSLKQTLTFKSKTP